MSLSAKKTTWQILLTISAAIVAIVFSLNRCVAVEPGETTSGVPIAKKDSLAMVALLEANGLPAEVRKYSVLGTVKDSAKVRDIKISGMQLSKFIITKSIEQLDSLYNVVLESNGIGSFSVPDSIVTIHAIIFQMNKNKLTAVTSDLMKINRVRYAYFYNNEIASLPENINHSGIELLGIVGNKLCQVPDSVANWLTTMNADWRLSQSCGPSP